MRKGIKNLKCLLAIVFFLPITAYGQPQKTDTIYTPQGKLHQIITTKGEDKRVQTFSYGGQMTSDVNFKNGKKYGEYKEFDSYGRPKIEAHYQDGFLEGDYKQFWPEGDLFEELHYEVFKVDGELQSLLQGKAKYYHSNGSLASEGKFEKGEKEGRWKFYNQNQLSEEKTFENGKLAGIQIRYHANGQLMSEADIYEDVTIDNVFYPNLVKGWNKQCYENGEKRSFTEIKNGQPTGNEKHWYENGALKSESEATDENRRVSKFYDDSGQLTFYIEQKKTLKNGYGKWVEDGVQKRFKNGKLTSVAHYRNGERHGKYENYGANGTIEASGEIYNGKSVGVSKNYYPNGQLKRIDQKDFVVYQSGDTGIVAHGWQKQFAENGQVTYETYQDFGKEIYQAQYGEGGNLISRRYQIHDLKWSQEYYPKGELKTDEAFVLSYKQKGVWYVNGAPQLTEIKNFYLPKFSVEITKDGTGAVLSAKKNGAPYEPDLQELKKLEFSQSGDFYGGENFSGDFALTFRDGSPRLTLALKDSLPHGEVRLYYPEGGLAYYAEMQNGLSRGISYLLNPAGDTLAWQRKGPRSELYRKSWHSDSIRNIVKTSQLGVQLYKYESYSDGAPYYMADYENNIHKRWYPDGQLSSESHPVEGNENRTVHREYYPNGQLRSHYYYENKKRVGPYESYYENGQLNTRSSFKDDQQNGFYESYFEDGSLRSKGEIIAGKKEGKWEVSRDGEIAVEYYKDDRLQIKPPTAPCECVDTALASGHYGFLNTLRLFLDYRKYKNLHLPFLQPLDSADFYGIFYKRHFEGGGEIIVYQPLTFRFDEDGKNTLTINACHTTGYISNMNITFWDRGDVRNTHLFLHDAQLRYVFENRQFEQNKSGQNITLLIESEEVEFDRENHITFEEGFVTPCFEPIQMGAWQLNSAKLKLLPNVSPKKTTYWFQNEMFDLRRLENLPRGYIIDTTEAVENPMSRTRHNTPRRKFSPTFERTSLNGFVAQSGAGIFKLKGVEMPFSLRYMWLTNDWATGVFDVEVPAIANDGSFFIAIQEEEKIEGTIPEVETELELIESNLLELQQQLEKDGFQNLTVKRYPNQNRIRIEFFNR